MKRCQWRGINRHPTRDAVTFSDAAAEATSVAIFRKGHNVTCRCMADEDCKPDDCDALYITDSGGNHMATLHGAEYRARQLANGSIAVYRASVRTDDAKPIMTLAELNFMNREHWKPKED